MMSCGRSICCSTLRSVTPSMSCVACCICMPSECSVVRSGPKILMAMPALVPDSMASIRCEMGCPISTFTPGSVRSLARMSAITSSLLRSFSAKGTSISLVFTPKACSSSSARPVLRATSFTSGTCNSSFSACSPMRSLSSNDTPGSVLTLMVNEPSLKGGKNERPKLKNSTMVRVTTAPVPIKMARLGPSSTFMSNCS